jgi:hypothetical protein
MTFNEFLAWLAAPAALGIVSSFIVTAIKALTPTVADRIAVLVSIIVAAVLSVGAGFALPYVGRIPPEIAAYWPIVVWSASQLWWELTKKRE